MSHAPPLVSVVLPCRGRPALLRRALASVQAQTLEAWEVVVADDASPEPLAPLVESLGDPRVRCLRLARNLGPAGAREAALAAARAPVASLLDSDDVWRPDKLARELARMRAGPPRVLVHAARVERDGRVRLRPARASRPEERMGAFLYVANQFAQASCITAPTLLARRAGFGGLRQYEDHFFLLRAEALGAAVDVSAEPLAEQRADAGAARLGARDDPARARAFLDAAGAMLTETERTGFALRCLGPGIAAEDRLAAARLAMRGLRRGAPLAGASVRLLARALAGETAYEGLRAAAHGLGPGAARRAG